MLIYVRVLCAHICEGLVCTYMWGSCVFIYVRVLCAHTCGGLVCSYM